MSLSYRSNPNFSECFKELHKLVSNIKPINTAVMDALYIWSLNPTSMSAGYGIAENKEFIRLNLYIRHGDKLRAENIDHVVKFVHNYLSSKCNKLEIYEVRSILRKLLKDLGAFSILRKEFLKRINELTTNEKSILYFSLGNIQEACDVLSETSAELRNKLKEIMGYSPSYDEIRNVIIKSGIASALLWISSRRDHKKVVCIEHSDLLGKEGIKELVNVLEREPAIEQVLSEFRECVRKCVSKWNSYIILLLLKLLSEYCGDSEIRSLALNINGMFLYRRLSKLLVVPCVRGVLRYVRTVRNSQGVTHLILIPESLCRVLKEELKSVIALINSIYSAIGEFIEEYMTRGEVKETELQGWDTCWEINVEEPDSRLRVKLCVGAVPPISGIPPGLGEGLIAVTMLVPDPSKIRELLKKEVNNVVILTVNPKEGKVEVIYSKKGVNEGIKRVAEELKNYILNTLKG